MTAKQEQVLALLRTRGSIGATTKEIEDICCVAASRDWIRRLRDAGHDIKTVECPRTESGCRVVRYVLTTPSRAVAEVRTLVDTEAKGPSPFPAAAQGELFTR